MHHRLFIAIACALTFLVGDPPQEIPLYRSFRPRSFKDEAKTVAGHQALKYNDIAFCVDPRKHPWTDILVRAETNEYWYGRLYLACEVVLRDSTKPALFLEPEVMAYVQWYEPQTNQALCKPETDGIPSDICPRLYLSNVCDLIPINSIVARVSLVPDLKGKEGRDFISVGPYGGFFPNLVIKKRVNTR